MTGPLPAPRNLTLAGTAGANTASFNWDAVTDARSYFVAWQKGDDESSRSSEVVSGPTANLRSLDQSTAYKIQVAASRTTHGGEPGPACAWVPFTTADRTPVRVAKAATPTISAIGTDRFTVSWPNASGATRYVLRYKVASGSTWAPLAPAISPRVVTGLSPGVAYEVQVRGTSDDSDGPWSDTATATTAT